MLMIHPLTKTVTPLFVRLVIYTCARVTNTADAPNITKNIRTHPEQQGPKPEKLFKNHIMVIILVMKICVS
jgi:hypothetical protein